MEIHVWTLGHGVTVQLASDKPLSAANWDTIARYAALAREAAADTEPLPADAPKGEL